MLMKIKYMHQNNAPINKFNKFNKFNKLSKKAGIETPYTFMNSLVLLFLIALFSIIYFFLLGGGKSDPTYISTDSFIPSNKLYQILNTEVQYADPTNKDYELKTFYDMISDITSSKEPEKIYENLSSLAILLKKMTIKPEAGYSTWAINAYDANTKQGIKHIAVSTNGVIPPGLVAQKYGGEDSRYKEYYKEEIILPIKNSNSIILTLHFKCVVCNEQDLKNYV